MHPLGFFLLANSNLGQLKIDASGSLSSHYPSMDHTEREARRTNRGSRQGSRDVRALMHPSVVPVGGGEEGKGPKLQCDKIVLTAGTLKCPLISNTIKNLG
jgi:hypothetical protein